ncbi:MAG: EF-hand domain-containing protein [Burkholderiales bacterium]|nr:EF-hand domain-containing protein [Burkholderiales bacterium]
MNFSTARPLQPLTALPASRAGAFSVRAWALTLSVSAAAALFAMGAHAQGAETPATAPPSGALAAELPTAPRYAAADLERAFGFMDGDHDGKISRQEASGFRGVAKNFDRADTNQDGFLSRKEFDTAMNYVKPK